MDILKVPFLVVVALTAEFGFWDGLGHAVALANVPHTAEALGQTFGVMLLFLGSQLFQWWRTRHAVREQVASAVASAFPLAPPLVVPLAAPAPDVV